MIMAQKTQEKPKQQDKPAPRAALQKGRPAKSGQPLVVTLKKRRFLFSS